MKNAIVLITCLFLLVNFNANAQFGRLKKAAKKVGSKAKKHTTKGVKKVRSKTKKYTIKGAKKVGSAAKTTKRYTIKGARKVGGAAKKYATKGGKLVFKGGKTFAGIIVSARGTILFQGYGIIKEVFVNGRIPKYRKITKREYNFANEYLFNSTLPSRSKILISNLSGVGNRPFVWPTGTGHFLINMSESGYKNALYKEGQFIHEIAHVWQLHISDNIKWTIGAITTQIKNSITNKNAYIVDCKDNWGSMNLEQQAKVAEQCFLDRKDGKFGECYEDKVIKHIRNGYGFD